MHGRLEAQHRRPAPRVPSSAVAGSTSRLHAWAPPFLRWAGSKRQSIPLLLHSAPPQFTRYFEPFAGSACLFFALRPAIAFVTDFNSELIDTYLTISKHPRLVYRAAVGHSVSDSEYYRIRAMDPSTMPSISRAARFLYLNRYCFNGIYRVNQTGRFNVPKGRKTGALPSEATVVRCSVALREASVSARDYLQAIDGCRPGDFVYLDPPYCNPARRYKGEYGYGTFTGEDLPEFDRALRRLDAAGAQFLVSYADIPEFADIAKAWNCTRSTVRRTVSAEPARRQHTYETILTNYDRS
jgi:DNA adenine methylase